VRTRTTLLLYAALLAVLVALGFPPAGIWPLTWVACGLFVRQALSPHFMEDRRTAALFWGTFATVVNVAGFYWVAHTLHEFGGLPWLASVPLTFGVYALLGTNAALFGYLWPWFSGWVDRKWPARWPRPNRYLKFAVWLAIFETLDLRVFPWTWAQSIGSDRWLLATVQTLDTWGWSLIFLAFVLGFAWLLDAFKGRALALRLAALAAAFFVPLYGLGAWKMQRFLERYPDRQPVALVQGNVGNYQKKLTKAGVEPTIRNVLAIHRDLMEKIAIRFAAEGSADAKGPEPWIVWPETSYPGFPLQVPSSAQVLKNWVLLTRGLHIVGTYEQGSIELAGRDFDVDFNIAALFHERTGYSGHYRKRIRMPFGEYIPGDFAFPDAYDLLPAVNHFGAGEKYQALPHPDPKGPVFVPLICYEVLFRGFVDEFVEQARKDYPGRPLVLVNLSNDSWYGPTSEPYTHSLLSRWSSARQGLPMLRPTNTGFSQVVAPWGEVLDEGPRDEAWVVFGKLPVERLQLRP
jgi:apolipoprotein N-acyltransferase